VSIAPAGLLDTSVFIARESGRKLDERRIPEKVAVSVVTLAELQAGVLAAPDTSTRARRLATLDVVADIAPVPVDAGAARHWAHLRARLAETGRRVNVNDLWIASTAVAQGMAVITQDDDFDPLAELGVTVVKV
jgi:predicted nucleic acid-binding protein